MKVYSIPAGVSFADTLAARMWQQAGQDPIRLSRSILLLPHRRAVQVMADAFLRLGDGRAMLLPEIRAVGDVEEDEPFAAAPVAFDAEAGDDCPPAISVLRRRLMLARLVALYLERRGGASSAAGGTPEQAVHLAADLGNLLDQMQTAAIPFERLVGLVPEQYATHWQDTLSFLQIISASWPDILDAEGAVDPVIRRDRMLRGLAERWIRDPPDRPVIIAGSTGTVPATAALMGVVGRLPAGAVVLPGLDHALDDDSWEEVGRDPAHPQFALASLLRSLELSRADVGDWGGGAMMARTRARMRLLSEAMRPAATTDRWRTLATGAVQRSDLAGFRLVECAAPQEEAGVIALMLRETLETEGRTAALVTPDRSLGRRVKAELRRWDIEINDSAGQPLGDTPQLAFCRLIAAAVAEDLAPVAFLAAMKHPLAGRHDGSGQFRRQVRRLEYLVLHGPRPEPRFDGLLAALAEREETGDDASRPDAATARGLAEWLARFRPAFREFEALIASEKTRFGDLLLAHCRLVEALAEESGGTEAREFWSGETGEQAASFLAELLAASGDWPEMRGGDYPPFLDALLSGMVYRPRYGMHPRLAILSPLEGRLQDYDRLILGGLNEGVWPPDSVPDPWLSRPMRAQLGLPPLEMRVGQSAHDFIQACGAREVFLTRSRRVDGTPAVPARWLLRLSAVLDALGLDGCLDDTEAAWRAWQARLDAPGSQVRRVVPPEPRPPVDARPRSFSVTQIATWQRNPYAIYARRILGLRALDALDRELGPADRGTMIHKALEDFVREGVPGEPPEALGRLLEHGRKAFGSALEQPAVWAFWWPRFERIARWFVEIQAERAPRIAVTHTEIEGRIDFAAAGPAVTVRAFADRLEQQVDGDWSIIDYKTGVLPRSADVTAGWAPQLPLEALILRRGGFESLPAGRCVGLEYWQLGGGDPAGTQRTHNKDVEALVDTAQATVEALVAAFDDPTTPYLAMPDPDRVPAYDDYGHLARLKEWF